MPDLDRGTLRDLAALFLFLAETDRHLSFTEVDVLVDRLRVHAEGWAPGDVRAVVTEVANEPERTVHDVIERLKYAAVPPGVRAAVLDDLAGIARADGELHLNEVAFVRALAKAWSLGPPDGLERPT